MHGSILEITPSHLWYLVGLILTDGNLSNDGRHICIVSKDTDLLMSLRKALRLEVKILIKSSGYNPKCKCTYIQFGHVQLYRKLTEVGLCPNKSLSLGKIDVPRDYFVDFLRGVIDGDGCIRRWTHPQNNNEQWELRITSAAPLFANWLHNEIKLFFGVRGTLLSTPAKIGKHAIFNIKFGKMAAREILKRCYYQGALAMNRKRVLAKHCVESYVGWTRSLTIGRGGEIGSTHET